MKTALAFLLATSALHADKIRDFWFSGAEICSYDLSQSRYGKNHPGHAELIFVTEPFLTGRQVKNENGKGSSTDVLKLNALTTFNTGVYSYRTMASTFRPMDLEKFPHALKSTTSIQDWCGQAFQQSNFRKGTWKTQIRSYFEDAGDSDLTLPAATLEEEFWITLRLDPGKLPSGKTKVIPSAIYTRFNHKPIQAYEAFAFIKESEGTTAFSLNYPALDRTLTIWFDTAFPHIIRKWTERTATGTTTATLRERLMNIEYWNLNDPDDASKRKQLGLKPAAD